MKGGTCPVCNAEIVESKPIMYTSYREGPCEHTYQTWCPSCKIELRRWISYAHDTGWCEWLFSSGQPSKAKEECDEAED